MVDGVSIVVPAFNEEQGVGAVVRELWDIIRKAGIRGEVIVVDDGSTDATAEVAAREGALVLRHRSNRGYGAALKTAITVANFEIIAITDADRTYPSAELPALLAELEHADMVVGARVGRNVHIPWARKPAKWALNKLANYVTGAQIPDLNSGLRVFRRDIALQYFPILPDQFSFTTTITLAMHCDKYAVSYRPIDYHQRTGKSKIVPWDAYTFAVLILRTAMLFSPLRVFLPLALICLIYGLAKMSIDLYRDPMISASALMALMSALFIVLIGTLGDALATRLGRLNQNTVAGIETQNLLAGRRLVAQPVERRRGLGNER